MGRMYSAVSEATGLTAAKDLIRISAPSDAILRVHEVVVTQDASETSEQLPLEIFRASTDGTGTSITPEALETGDAAFGGTAVGNLTADTTKSGTSLWRQANDVRAGWHYLPTPDDQIVVPPSGRIVVRLDPGSSFTSVNLSTTVTFEEIG